MELSWSELLIVGLVALIVIGPKDLPGMFRELGRFTAKIRSMGREFSRAMEQAAKETGVKDVADDLRKVTSPKAMGLEAVKSAADKFEKWDPMKNPAVPTKPLTPPPMPAATTPAATAPAATTPAATTPAPAAAVVAEAVPAAAPVGPATAALYQQKAARKAVLDEAAAKLKAISPADATASAPAPKTPGRRRKKPESPAGDAE